MGLIEHMTRKNKVLFFYTKQYPYGTAEVYIADELSFLSKTFDKILIFPMEQFAEKENPVYRQIPDNAEVVEINNFTEKVKPGLSILSRVRLIMEEMLNEKRKFSVLLNFRRYFGILSYQSMLATFFKKYILMYSGDDTYYYSYWCHHACIMLGMLKEKGLIKAFVSRAHSMDLYHSHWTASGVGVLPFRHFKFRSLSAIFPVSMAGEKFLKVNHPEVSDRAKCFYLGVADNGLSPIQSGMEFTIVSCSSLTANKRIPLIIEILSAMKINMRWIHFGGGVEKENISEQVKRIPPHVNYELRGQVGHQEIIRFYKENCVNLFLNVSEAEGIPVTMMEAISFGIPVMATSVYGNPEIANEETGFSIPEKFEPGQVAHIIENFAGNFSLQMSKRVSARKYYELHFQMAKNYPKFMTELLRYSNL